LWHSPCVGCGGHGRGGLGGVVLEELLPHHPGFHFHPEMAMQMGDHTRAANVVIYLAKLICVT
jgi:hypothetical protein